MALVKVHDDLLDAGHNGQFSVCLSPLGSQPLIPLNLLSLFLETLSLFPGHCSPGLPSISLDASFRSWLFAGFSSWPPHQTRECPRAQFSSSLSKHISLVISRL